MILTPKGATWKLLIRDKKHTHFRIKNETKYQLHRRGHILIQVQL